MEIMNKIEKNPLYFPLQGKIHKRRLNYLKEGIKKMIGDQFTT